MEKFNELRASISREINQNELLQKNLLIQIMSSRRMLGEHCDLLEEAVVDLPALDRKHSNVVSLLSTTGVVTTCGVAFSLMKNHYRYLIPCISGAIPVFYATKLVNSRKRAKSESGLQDFIKALDEFEFAFKKIQTFFNDAMIMEQHAKILDRYNKDNKVAINLVYTIKRVIRALYCFLKYLEAFYKIDEKLKCIYPEVDDVDNCEIMCQQKYDYGDSKTYKDFFSLYAFVQSHLLLRLGMVFASTLSETQLLLQKKLPDITSKVKTQTKLLPSFLDISKYTPKLKDSVQKQINAQLAKTLPKDLMQIRTTTIEFTLKALSLAIVSQEFDASITRLVECYQNPTKKAIDNVMNHMEAIESQIAVCSNEQNHLMILIKKYLNKETEEEKKTEQQQQPNDENPAEPNLMKIVSEEDVPPQKDEFFYLDPSAEAEEKKDDDHEKAQNHGSNNADEEEMLMKKTKKCFKPVLQQLKQRIVVIDEDMKEREKKSLKEKGIEVPENALNNEPGKSCLDAEELDEDAENWEYVTERRKKRKDKKANRKYELSRDFLKSKAQLNLLTHAVSAPIPTPFTIPHEEYFEKEDEG